MRNLLVTLVLILGGWPSLLLANEIIGQIGAVSGQDVGIVLTGDFVPKPGDRFIVVVDIPDAGESRIASGKINSIENGIALGTITESTGQVAMGQKARLDAKAAEGIDGNNPSAVMPASVAPGDLPCATALGLVVRGIDQAMADLLDLPSAQGCIVTQVLPNSPAENSGLKKRDVVRFVDGSAVADAAALETVLANLKAPVAKIEVWRDGVVQAISVSLPAIAETVPASASANAATQSTASATVWIGLQVANFRDDVRATNVVPGSPAARAGFRAGDVLLRLDGTEITLITEFVPEIAATLPGKTRRLEITRAGQPLVIDLIPAPKPTDQQLFLQMKKLAEAGDHDAEYCLALNLEFALGTPERDLTQAAGWMQKAAQAGNALAQTVYGQYLLTGIGVEVNPGEGVEWIRKAAELGEPNAILLMARNYLNGTGVEKNNDESRRWFQLALETGSLDAIVSVGQLYEYGIVFEKDLAKAVELYRSAAVRGNLAAQFALGTCYRDGTGVAKDLATAAQWLKKSSDAGYVESHLALGLMYLDGIGIVQNPEEAVNLFRKGAAVEHKTSMHNLGYCYQHGLGVKEDQTEATRWYQAAADRGLVDSYYTLATRFAHGLGVAQSDEKAVEWYRKSAEAGEAVGQHNLAYQYFDGRGVPQSDAEAVKWFRKAAEQQYALSQSQLGFMSLNGRGTNVNLKAAFDWFELAAKQGLAHAQYNLGYCYETGQGVPVNRGEAIRWYQRAATQKMQDAMDALKRLGVQ